MAFQGGVHVNASGAFTDDAATAIAAQIAAQISAWESKFFNQERRQLLDTIGPLNAQMFEQTGRIDAIIDELTTVTKQLNDQIPDTKRAQAAAAETLEALSKRDQEVSDKLKQSFTDVESQLGEMRIQSEATRSAQGDIHTVVARQKVDLDNVRLEVGKYVTETLASVHA